MRTRPLIMLIILCTALGVGAGAIFFPTPLPASVPQTIETSEVSVSSKIVDGTQTAEIQVELSTETMLTFPSSGRVTQIDCVPGNQWHSGDAPLFIDGRPVLMLFTEQPFWRDLHLGARGKDVEMVQHSLQGLDFNLEVTGEFDWHTLEALNELVLRVGGVREDMMSLSRFVWIPEETVRVSACEISTGTHVASGAELTTVGGLVQSIRLRENPDAEHPRLAVFGGVEAPIDDEGVITSSEFLAAFESSHQFNRWLEDQSQPLTVETRYEKPIEVRVIPPASIIETLGGNQACVATSDDGVWVTIIGSELGQTFVQGDLPDTVTVGDIQDRECT